MTFSTWGSGLHNIPCYTGPKYERFIPDTPCCALCNTVSICLHTPQLIRDYNLGLVTRDPVYYTQPMSVSVKVSDDRVYLITWVREPPPDLVSQGHNDPVFPALLLQVFPGYHPWFPVWPPQTLGNWYNLNPRSSDSFPPSLATICNVDTRVVFLEHLCCAGKFLCQPVSQIKTGYEGKLRVLSKILHPKLNLGKYELD